MLQAFGSVRFCSCFGFAADVRNSEKCIYIKKRKQKKGLKMEIIKLFVVIYLELQQGSKPN